MCPTARPCRHVATDLLGGVGVVTSVLTRATPCCGTCAISGRHLYFHLSFPRTKLPRSMCLRGHPLQLKSNLHQDQFCMSLLMLMPWLVRSFYPNILRYVLAASVSRHLGHEERIASQMWVSFCASERAVFVFNPCSLFWCSVSRLVLRRPNLRRQAQEVPRGRCPDLVDCRVVKFVGRQSRICTLLVHRYFR